MGSILTGQEIQLKRFWVIAIVLIIDAQVTQQSPHHIIILVVGGDIDMSTQRQSHGLFGQFQVIKVYLADIGLHGGLQLLAVVSEPLQGQRTPHQVIIPVYMKSHFAIRHVHIPLNTAQIVGAHAKFPYAGLSLQTGAGRENVRANALGLQISCKRLQFLAREEMGNLERVGGQVHVVGHALSVQAAFQPHFTTSFFHGKLGSVSTSLGRHVARQMDVIWHTHRFLQIRAQHGGHKSELIGFHVHVDICSQPVHVRHVSQPTLGFHPYGSGKIQFQSRERHPLHVSLYGTIDG